MIIELSISILLGILTGTLTGLIPGIHINLLGTILLFILNKLDVNLNKIYLLAFVCSLSIAHTFSDFIPSVFLGCPNTETSLLPGHKLLKEGKGLQAIFLSSYGSLAGIILILALSPLVIILTSNTSKIITPFIAYILIGISIILFIKEKNKIDCIKIILISSLTGLIVLNLDLNEPLLPMFSGLFGIPLILESIKNKTEIKEQEKYLEKPNKKAKSILLAGISSVICGFLPGLGTSQSAVLSSSFYQTTKEEFLVLIGAANTIVLIMSFLTLYTIGKTRTGVSVILQEIAPQFSYKVIILILISVFVSGIFSFLLTIFISKKISERINRYDYKKISIAVLVLIITINLIIGGIANLAILILCSLIGLYSNKLNVRKSNMMYCLLTPTIWFYLTNN